MSKPPGPNRMSGGTFLLICVVVALVCAACAFYSGWK